MMSGYKTKYSPLFFSLDDETKFCDELKKNIPGICFIDGSVWNSTIPPAQNRINDCKSEIIFLWDKQLYPKLPTKLLESGKVLGPTSGMVIQFIRCHLSEGKLLSGDLGIGYLKADKKLCDFVNLVWEILKRLDFGPLVSYEPITGLILQKNISSFIVGSGALSLAASGVRLKHASSDCYYRKLEHARKTT